MPLFSFATYRECLTESTMKLNGLPVMTLDTFLDQELVEAPTPFLGAKTRTVPEDELSKYLDRVKTQTKTDRDKYDNPIIHRSNIEIRDEQNRVFDTEKLKAAVKKRPTALLTQNEKMQHSDGTTSIFFNIGLPALKGLAVNEATNEFVIVDTCPGAGICKTYCYAMKGSYVQYKDTSMKQTRVLNFLLNDPSGFAAQLTREIQKAHDKFMKKGDIKLMIRWHDAGDFFSPQYLELAYSIAEKFPDVSFYAYTKMANVAQSKKPDNFLINFSAGAQPTQQKKVDLRSTKHSDVVPREMFWDLIARENNKLVKDDKNRMQFKDEASLIRFKQRLAQKYSLNIDTILTYDEMMATPVSSENAKKWNVIVVPGDGDDSAARPDVLGTYLLWH